MPDPVAQAATQGLRRAQAPTFGDLTRQVVSRLGLKPKEYFFEHPQVDVTGRNTGLVDMVFDAQKAPVSDIMLGTSTQRPTGTHLPDLDDYWGRKTFTGGRHTPVTQFVSPQIEAAWANIERKHPWVLPYLGGAFERPAGHLGKDVLGSVSPSLSGAPVIEISDAAESALDAEETLRHELVHVAQQLNFPDANDTLRRQRRNLDYMDRPSELQAFQVNLGPRKLRQKDIELPPERRK